MGNFKAFNLSAKMVDALAKQGYISPSSIQEKVIPKALKGQSIVAQSATGTGKSHAFIIPLIEKTVLSKNKLQSIIIAPTRELAKQTYDFIRRFNAFYPELKVRLMASSEEKDQSVEGLSIAPQIVVGTPGRLSDLLINNHLLDLSLVSKIVLDEADMMMEMGYFNDINLIISAIKNPQLLVFSATIKENLKYELEKYVQADFFTEAEETETSSSVVHYLVDIKHIDLLKAVDEFIAAKNPFFLIIFASKKETVQQIYSHLRVGRNDIGLLYGDLLQRERKQMIKRIKSGEFPIVVCSDMAARGLDIDDVSEVLSVDLPMELDYYFHRAGRTGRFGKHGESYVFYNSDSVKKPLELISHGIAFNYLSLKDGVLSQGKPLEQKRVFKSKRNLELDKEIKKAKAITKNDKVKPNYRKKTKIAVDKVIKKHRREVIRKDIRRQQVERYKENNKKED